MDGYGNNFPSWAISPSPRFNDSELRWLLAYHLRLDHRMPMYMVARRTGLPYVEVRDKLKDVER
jgi:hypothetical protein